MGKILDTEVYKITATEFCALQEETKEEDRVSALKKLLNSGVFYFSWPNSGSNFDLTIRAQEKDDDSYQIGNSFFWLVPNLGVLPKPWFKMFGWVSLSWVDIVGCYVVPQIIVVCI